jgi:hypothetical protein
VDQQQKARRAKQLLEDPVLTEALETARDTFVDEWIAAGTVEDREACWGRIHGLAEVLNHLVWLAEQLEPDEDEEEPTVDIP